MYKYLITLEPLEAYFFGGERTFGFGNKTGQKPPYYIVSENAPSQPTLFGTLRYIILAQKNALRGQDNHKYYANYIGEESFSFEKVRKGEEQNFGIINRISPLFLIKKDVWFIRTPMDHKPKTKKIFNQIYTPFTLTESPVYFGNDAKLYPLDYDAKDGFGEGYISLSCKKVIPDDEIFQSITSTGINSHRTEDTSNGINDDSSFFKKERKILAKDYKFAFIADLSECLNEETTIVFMGQNKSPFHCTITQTDQDLLTKTKNAFKDIRDKRAQKAKYALSDVLPIETRFPDGLQLDYFIAETKVIRNLETNINAESYYTRLKKSEKLYKIMTAGSVFYTDQEILKNSLLEKIGMNILIDF